MRPVRCRPNYRAKPCELPNSRARFPFAQLLREIDPLGDCLELTVVIPSVAKLVREAQAELRAQEELPGMEITKIEHEGFRKCIKTLARAAETLSADEYI